LNTINNDGFGFPILFFITLRCLGNYFSTLSMVQN
jgi:hypothetical protein